MQNNAKKVIAVFDTNIWISYFICNKSVALKELIVNNDVVLFRSDALTVELESVILRPKFSKYSMLPAAQFVELYLSLTQNFATIPVFTACPDPKDNFLFDLAMQSGANYLVSGDKQVIATATIPNLSVITLAQFEKLLFNL